MTADQTAKGPAASDEETRDHPVAARSAEAPPKHHPRGGHRPAHLLLYVDGGSSGNPGPCGSAAVLKDADGTTLLEKARAFGPATNNVAEYQAVILGLELAAPLRPQRLTIRSDSELLVRQLAGQYKVKAPHLKPLVRQVQRMLEPFESVEIEHILRTENTEADRLVRKAMEKARQVDAQLPPEARKKPRQHTFRLK
jgi:ribonuclease HI